MKADSLPLPDGVHSAKYVDNMREVSQFDVRSDGYLYRWDTMINGKQESFTTGPVDSIDEIIAAREQAKAHFKAIECKA